MNTRGVQQLIEKYHHLQGQAKKLLPAAHPEWGELIGIDGSQIDAMASIQWADYRDDVHKAKVNVGLT